jgi:hypothetical protein
VIKRSQTKRRRRRSDGIGPLYFSLFFSFHRALSQLVMVQWRGRVCVCILKHNRAKPEQGKTKAPKRTGGDERFEQQPTV